MNFISYMRKPLVSVMLAILAIVFLSYTLMLFALRLETEDPFYQVWSNVVYIGSTIMCTAIIFSVYTFYGAKNPEGRTWLFMFLGMAGFLTGEILWSAFDLAGMDPFPSVADAFFLMGYGFLGVGLVYKLHSAPLSVDIKKISVIALIVFALLIPTTIFVGAPIMQDDSYGVIDKAVSLAYPALDFVLLILALFAALYLGGEVSKGWYISAAGFIVLCVADVFYAALEWQEYSTAYLDSFWILSYVLIALAAVYQMELHKEFLE